MCQRTCVIFPACLLLLWLFHVVVCTPHSPSLMKELPSDASSPIRCQFRTVLDSNQHMTSTERGATKKMKSKNKRQKQQTRDQKGGLTHFWILCTNFSFSRFSLSINVKTRQLCSQTTLLVTHDHYFRDYF